MRTKILSLIVALSTGTTATLTNAAPSVLAYWPNWATYSVDWQPNDINPQHVDKILYAFFQAGNCAQPYPTEQQISGKEPIVKCTERTNAGFSGALDNKLHSTDQWSDFSSTDSPYGGKANIHKILALGKPVYISIGGWSLSASLRRAYQSEHREAFANSIVEFVTKPYGGGYFAGIDIDWEPNANRWTMESTAAEYVKVTQQDLVNFELFLRTLKAKLQQAKPGLALTIAAPAGEDVVRDVEKTYPGFWKRIAGLLDTINIMTYDYHGPWGGATDDVTNFNAPLKYDPRQRSKYNVEHTLQAYKDVGVNAAKLIIGVPAYGRVYQGVEKQGQPIGLYQKYRSAGEVCGLDGAGIIRYRHLINKKCAETDIQFESQGIYPLAQQVTAIWERQGNLHFTNYDNPQTASTKMQYVKEKGLAGIMVWDYSGDIKKDEPHYQSSSILYALKQAAEEK